MSSGTGAFWRPGLEMRAFSYMIFMYLRQGLMMLVPQDDVVLFLCKAYITG
jgi:hypothetical protein